MSGNAKTEMCLACLKNDCSCTKKQADAYVKMTALLLFFEYKMKRKPSLLQVFQKQRHTTKK